MFRKLVATVALALCAATSFAAQTSIDTSGLSDAQVAALKAHAAQVVAEAAKGDAATPAKDASAMVTLAATWGPQMAQAAEGFAKAIGIAARELNVTANEFLASDAGKLTAALIIWKVAGAGVIKLMYGMIYMRLFTAGYEKVEYSRFGGFFKGTKMIRTPKTFRDLNNDGEWLAFWVLIVVLVGTMLIGGVIIA